MACTSCSQSCPAFCGVLGIGLLVITAGVAVWGCAQVLAAWLLLR